jgi:hypothetical protein
VCVVFCKKKLHASSLLLLLGKKRERERERREKEGIEGREEDSLCLCVLP